MAGAVTVHLVVTNGLEVVSDGAYRAGTRAGRVLR